MEKEKLNNQSKPPKYSFTTISDYFLDKWSGVVGVGPTSLYIHLLKYCYKEKNLAWPTLKTLSKKMGVSERTLIRYRKTLVKYGFIQNIFKRNSTSRNNIYQMTLGQDLTDSKLLSSMMTNCKVDGDKMSSCIVTKSHPNNNNIKHNNITTTKEGKDVVVDFKKLKEKGDLSASTCAYPHADRCNAQVEEKMQAIREQLKNLDFEGKFIEQLLKDYPTRKIEEKLDLLLNRRNIQNPAGWLVAALKNDYQDPEQERYAEEPAGPVSHLPRMDSRFHGNDIKSRENDRDDNGNDPVKARLYRVSIGGSGNNDKKFLSREELIRRFHLLGQKLKAMNYSQSKS